VILQGRQPVALTATRLTVAPGNAVTLGQLLERSGAAADELLKPRVPPRHRLDGHRSRRGDCGLCLISASLLLGLRPRDRDSDHQKVICGRPSKTVAPAKCATHHVLRAICKRFRKVSPTPRALFL